MKNRGIKLAKKAFQSRPRRFSVVWMLPNFLTICALIFGLQAMYQALFSNWDNVIIMIIIKRKSYTKKVFLFHQDLKRQH